MCPPRYLDQVLRTDREVFDGVRSWDDLKRRKSLLPSIVINDMLDRMPGASGNAAAEGTEERNDESAAGE